MGKGDYDNFIIRTKSPKQCSRNAGQSTRTWQCAIRAHRILTRPVQCLEVLRSSQIGLGRMRLLRQGVQAWVTQCVGRRTAW